MRIVTVTVTNKDSEILDRKTMFLEDLDETLEVVAPVSGVGEIFNLGAKEY